MDNSISVSITPRGQQFFANHLSQVLLGNGFSLDEGSFKTWKYSASEPISLEKLPMSLNGQKKTIGDLRDLIQRTFEGIKLNDPQVNVTVNGIQYNAKFSHFGVRIDSVSSAQEKNPNTVVLDLEVEIPTLSISARQIRVLDTRNPELQPIGLNSFHAQTAKATSAKTGKAVNLKFRVPLEVSFDADGLLVKALSVDTNLPLVNIDWGYAHPALLPPIQGTVGTEHFKVDYSEFEREIANRERALAKSLQSYLKNYLTENGAKMIDDMLNTNHLTKVLEDVNSLDALNAPSKQAKKLLWGLIPTGLRYERGTLEANLSTYVEDPAAAREYALPPQRANGAPDLSAYGSDTYDLSLSVDELMVNRMLQHSYNRGYFSKIDMNGQSISLTEAPYFILDSSVGRNQVKLHVFIDQVYHPQGITEKIQAAIALRNPVHVSFDLIARLKVDPAKGTVALISDHIDLNSTNLDPKSVKFGFLRDQVLDAVKQQLNTVNKSFTAKECTLAAPFELPHGMMGIPLRFKDVQSDPSGHFNVFAELKQ